MRCCVKLPELSEDLVSVVRSHAEARTGQTFKPSAVEFEEASLECGFLYEAS